MALACPLSVVFDMSLFFLSEEWLLGICLRRFTGPAREPEVCRRHPRGAGQPVTHG
jgi:hypothetical protein